MLLLVFTVYTCHMTLRWFCYDAAQSSQCMRFLYYRICIKPLFKHARLAIKRSQTPNFCMDLHLCPYFVCASSEGSGETVWMRNLARAFTSRICDKSQILMNWLYTVLLYLLRRIFRLFHPLLWRGVPVTNYVP